MKNNWRVKLARKRLAESIQGIHTLIIGNALLFVCLVIFGGESFIEDKNAHFSLLSMIFMYCAFKWNDWHSKKTTILIVIGYLIIAVYEMVMVGLPEGYIPRGEFSKGMLLEIILLTLPLTYLVMRFSLIVAVLPVFIKQKKVKEVLRTELI